MLRDFPRLSYCLGSLVRLILSPPGLQFLIVLAGSFHCTEYSANIAPPLLNTMPLWWSPLTFPNLITSFMFSYHVPYRISMCVGTYRSHDSFPVVTFPPLDYQRMMRYLLGLSFFPYFLTVNGGSTLICAWSPTHIPPLDKTL